MPVETFHVVFVGDQGVGKTSILNRYLNNHYSKYEQGT